MVQSMTPNTPADLKLLISLKESNAVLQVKCYSETDSPVTFSRIPRIHWQRRHQEVLRCTESCLWTTVLGILSPAQRWRFNPDFRQEADPWEVGRALRHCAKPSCGNQWRSNRTPPTAGDKPTARHPSFKRGSQQSYQADDQWKSSWPRRHSCWGLQGRWCSHHWSADKTVPDYVEARATATRIQGRHNRPHLQAQWKPPVLRQPPWNLPSVHSRQDPSPHPL